MSPHGGGWLAMGLAGTVIALAVPFLIWWVLFGPLGLLTHCWC